MDTPVSLERRAVHYFFLHKLSQERVGGSVLGDLTTDQVVQTFIKPATAALKHSFAECIISGGLVPKYMLPWSTAGCLKGPTCLPQQAFGRARYFASHAWSYKFGALVSMLGNHYASLPGSQGGARYLPVFYWIDILAVSQHFTGDFKDHPDSDFQGVIRSCKAVLFTMHPWRSPIAPTRVWCLFEALTAIQAPGVDIEVVVDVKDSKDTRVQTLQIISSSIEVRTAQATVSSDKAYILGCIESGIGISAFNAAIRKRLREALMAAVTPRAIEMGDTAAVFELLKAGGCVRPDGICDLPACFPHATETEVLRAIAALRLPRADAPRPRGLALSGPARCREVVLSDAGLRGRDGEGCGLREYVETETGRTLWSYLPASPALCQAVAELLIMSPSSGGGGGLEELWISLRPPRPEDFPREPPPSISGGDSASAPNSPFQTRSPGLLTLPTASPSACGPVSATAARAAARAAAASPSRRFASLASPSSAAASLHRSSTFGSSSGRYALAPSAPLSPSLTASPNGNGNGVSWANSSGRSSYCGVPSGFPEGWLRPPSATPLRRSSTSGRLGLRSARASDSSGCMAPPPVSSSPPGSAPTRGADVTFDLLPSRAATAPLYAFGDSPAEGAAGSVAMTASPPPVVLPPGRAALWAGVGASSMLRMLCLHQAVLGTRDLQLLAAALARSKTLETLQAVRCVATGDGGGDADSPASSVGIGGGTARLTAELLALGLSCPRLRQLHVRPAEVVVIEEFAQPLEPPAGSQLRSLTLAPLALGPTAVRQLGGALARLPYLHTLVVGMDPAPPATWMPKEAHRWDQWLAHEDKRDPEMAARRRRLRGLDKEGQVALVANVWDLSEELATLPDASRGPVALRQRAAALSFCLALSCGWRDMAAHNRTYSRWAWMSRRGAGQQRHGGRDLEELSDRREEYQELAVELLRAAPETFAIRFNPGVERHRLGPKSRLQEAYFKVMHGD